MFPVKNLARRWLADHTIVHKLHIRYFKMQMISLLSHLTVSIMIKHRVKMTLQEKQISGIIFYKFP